MAQRYTAIISLGRMKVGTCPECGGAPEEHSNDLRFWLPRACDLTQTGVVERIEQYRQDNASTWRCDLHGTTTATDCPKCDDEPIAATEEAAR